MRSDDVAWRLHVPFSELDPSGQRECYGSEFGTFKYIPEKDIFVGNERSNWQEFRDAAEKMFNVWVNGSELQWAEQTWAKLTDAGLTSYGTELARTEVSIRLMTLGAIYLDFCHIAWREGDDVLLQDWARALDIQPFHLGRLIGQDPEGLEEIGPGADEFELLQEAYVVLTDHARKTIHPALCPSPADAPQVYLAMFLTKNGDGPEKTDEAWAVTGPNSDALAFVMDGFPRDRDY